MWWRTTLALISALWLTAALAITAVADSHTTAPPTVTTVPSTGVGTMANSLPDGTVLVLLGLAVALALAAVRQRQRA